MGFDRRDILKLLPCAFSLAQRTLAGTEKTDGEDLPFFRTRGVVLLPEDLALQDWPERAKRAGLTTIALHDGSSARTVAKFVHSAAGVRFLEQSRRLELNVEYELHAMSDLLPRNLFRKSPGLFRMNEKGERTADANLCVHSQEALEMVCANAVELSGLMSPTTGRYFFWGDDGQPWCRCPQCHTLNDSDQALTVTNAILQAGRRHNPKATMAHLAYANTLIPPETVKPEPGVFLEFAPINRRYDTPLDSPTDPDNQRHLKALDANLNVFARDNAQVLEYWLDVSRFSKWKKPAQKLPFDLRVFTADLNAYGSRGFRHVTSFAAYMDAAYFTEYGDPPLNSYGTELRHWRPHLRVGDRDIPRSRRLLPPSKGESRAPLQHSGLHL